MNNIIKPRNPINKGFLGFVLAKCLQFVENTAISIIINKQGADKAPYFL